jgi:hypothetical protein
MYQAFPAYLDRPMNSQTGQSPHLVRTYPDFTQRRLCPIVEQGRLDPLLCRSGNHRLRLAEPWPYHFQEGSDGYWCASQSDSFSPTDS